MRRRAATEAALQVAALFLGQRMAAFFSVGRDRQ